jgi:hypothetical protein
MSELMGRNEYARHRGCAPNAVSKAIKDGRIASALVQDDGKFIGIKWRLADELWLLNTDPDQQLRGHGGILPPAVGTQMVLQTSAPSAPGEPEDDAPLAGVTPADRDELVRHRTEKARLENQMTELDLAKRRGELVSLSEERELRTKRYRSIRDKLLGIADRVAAVLAAERDPVQVHAVLTREITQVLHELSDDARREADRGTAEPMAA